MRVALFLIFGVCNISVVLEPFWEGLGEGFGSFLGDFGWILVFLKGSKFEFEVGSRKSGSRLTKGTRLVGDRRSGRPLIDR